MAGLFFKSSTRFIIPTCRSIFLNQTKRTLWSTSTVPMIKNFQQPRHILNTGTGSGTAQKMGKINHYTTEVDRDLHEFLTKEIALERKESKENEFSKILDFTVTTDDSEVVLTKQWNNEKLTVTFDINNSVSMELPVDMESDKEAPPNTVSKPPFMVEITNAGNKTLSIQCSFPLADDVYDEEVDPQDKPGAEQEDGMDDLFEIDEVAIYEGELTDNTYNHHSSVMDGNLYEYLMDMLDERGINSEFISAMTQFSTAYEHQKYVSFLEQLQSFVDHK